MVQNKITELTGFHRSFKVSLRYLKENAELLLIPFTL